MLARVSRERTRAAFEEWWASDADGKPWREAANETPLKKLCWRAWMMAINWKENVNEP